MESYEGAKRPLMVTILGALYVIMGILFGLLFFEIPPLAIIIALIYIVIGVGFLRGWKIMWYLGVIFSILGIIGGLFTLLVLVGIIPLIINIIILVYLFKPNVKRFFLG